MGEQGQTFDRTWFIADRQCLGDPEHWHAVELIGPDGSNRWMLAEPDHECHHCPLPDVPEHEQTGPLPAALAWRARAAPFRCGAPTATGVPCRMLVHQPN